MTRGYTPPDLPEEEDIFEGDDGGHPLTDVQFRLYRILKRSMDRQSCVAGDRSKISYSGLRQRLYQPSRRGFAGTGDSWGTTIRQQNEYIRRQVEVLEERGLIKRTTLTGGDLRIEFLIFKQFRDMYFSVKNKLSAFYPQNSPQTYQPKDCNNDLLNNELLHYSQDEESDSNRTKNAKPSTYPEVSRSNITTATTVGDAESFIAQDSIANAMLEGGMQEYHIAMGLPVIANWRKLNGFSEVATITLIKTRLGKNPNVNSVNYFTGAIEQLCTYALEKPNHASSDLRKRDASRYASRKEPASVRLEREARELGMLY